jgi:transcriptional antiterminator NusG
MKPIPLGIDEVEKLMLEADKVEEKPKLQINFEAGDGVKIKEGPFQNFDGVVEEVIPDKGLVRVVVTIFGRATPVELEYWQVETL